MADIERVSNVLVGHYSSFYLVAERPEILELYVVDLERSTAIVAVSNLVSSRKVRARNTRQRE